MKVRISLAIGFSGIGTLGEGIWEWVSERNGAGVSFFVGLVGSDLVLGGLEVVVVVVTKWFSSVGMGGKGKALEVFWPWLKTWTSLNLGPYLGLTVLAGFITGLNVDTVVDGFTK